MKWQIAEKDEIEHLKKLNSGKNTRNTARQTVPVPYYTNWIAVNQSNQNQSISSHQHMQILCIATFIFMNERNEEHIIYYFYVAQFDWSTIYY